jgi:di/tricarboxylate transporter
MTAEAFILVFGLATAFVVAGLIGVIGDWLVKKFGDDNDIA